MCSLYILIPFDDSFEIFKSYLQYFINKTKLYKIETKEKISFYKTGTDSKTILDLFHYYTKNILPDILEQDEVQWILNATQGSIIYGEFYEMGKDTTCKKI